MLNSAKLNLASPNAKNMDNMAFFSIIFIGSFLVSMTGYSIYTGFGPPSNNLRDPFEEHED